jgi:hypothetical protein
LGGAVPLEFGTCWAFPSRMATPDVAATAAAIDAALINVRRPIMVSPVSCSDFFF